MKALNDPICVRRWQACLALGMSGLAIGMLLAKLTSALGL